jgi:hypothetical protein
MAMMELLLKAENSLALGMLDQAERVYWQAIEHDARNAIAVVGLARVALERGDEWTAMDFAGRALAIDPDNATARRLLIRLQEVIERRGDGPRGMPTLPHLHAPEAAQPAPSVEPAVEPEPELAPEAGPALAVGPGPTVEPVPEPTVEAVPEPEPEPEPAPEPAPALEPEPVPAPTRVFAPLPSPPPAPQKRGLLARLFRRS